MSSTQPCNVWPVSYKATMHIEFCQSEDYIITLSDSNSTSGRHTPWQSKKKTNMQDHVRCVLLYRAEFHPYQHHMSLAATLQEQPRPWQSHFFWSQTEPDTNTVQIACEQPISHVQTLEIWNLLGWPRKSECHTVDKATSNIPVPACYLSITLNGEIHQFVLLLHCVSVSNLFQKVGRNYDGTSFFNMAWCTFLTNRARIEFSGCWNRNTLSTIEAFLSIQIEAANV